MRSALNFESRLPFIDKTSDSPPDNPAHLSALSEKISKELQSFSVKNVVSSEFYPFQCLSDKTDKLSRAQNALPISVLF